MICIHNVGEFSSRTAVGFIQKATKDDASSGFFWPQVFFVALNVVGLGLNIWLTVIDIKYYGGKLCKVDRGDRLPDLMKSSNESIEDTLDEQTLY